MNACSHSAQLAFVKLILAVDDYGRIDGRIPVLKGLLFPLDEAATEAAIGAWLGELEREGCLEFYGSKGRPFLHLCNWERHRGKTKRAGNSKCPSPEDRDDVLNHPGASRSRASPEIRGKSGDPSGGMESGVEGMESRERNTKESPPPAVSVLELWPGIQAAFGAYGKRLGSSPSAARRQRLASIVKQHGTEAPCHAVHGYRWLHRIPSAQFDPERHFTPDTIFRPSKIEKYLEAYADAESEGRSPPFHEEQPKTDSIEGLAPRNRRMARAMRSIHERTDQRRDPSETARVVTNVRRLPDGSG